MTIGDRFRRWNAARHQTTADVEARYGARPAPPQAVTRAPLTAAQHILHLLLTVLTGGLWGIVWIIRARQGNRR
jgi:hypothetical protein